MVINVLAAALLALGVLTAPDVATRLPIMSPQMSPAASGSWTVPATIWSSPQSAGAPANLTQVVDSQGRVTALWSVSARSAIRVMSSRFDGRSWSKAARIGTAPLDPNGPHLRLAVGPTDEVVGAWATSAGSHVRVGAARFRGGSWGPPTSLGDQRGRVLQSLALAADDSGVSAIWQVAPYFGAGTGALTVRGLPRGATSWTPATVLDDAAATVPASVVRDGPGTTRAVWVSGASIVSAQGSATSWGAHETLGTSTPPATSLAAAADESGNVLAAWLSPHSVGVPWVVTAAQHSVSGWAAPITALTDSSWGAASVVMTSIGAGMPPTIVVSHVSPKADPIREFLSWSGTAWTSVQQAFDDPVQSSGTPFAVGGAMVTLDVVGNCSLVVCQRATTSWLSSKIVSGASVSPAARVSGSAKAVITGFAGLGNADGSVVAVFGKSPAKGSAGVWSARYTAGAWSAPTVVSKARRTSAKAFPATPVSAADGTVTLAWLSGRNVIVSRSR